MTTRFSSLHGFTLIELMVTISILAIAAAFAVPSFQSIIEGAKHRGVISDLNASVALARSEAVKRGVPVVLAAKVAGANGLGKGWRIFVDDPANAGVFSAATPMLLDQAPYDNTVSVGLGTMSGGSELLTFAAAGNVVLGGAGTGNRLIISTGTSNSGTICLAFGGRSRYMDKNIAASACN